MLILHVKTRLKMAMEKRFAIHQLLLVKIPMLLCHDLFSLGDILEDMEDTDITDTDTDITVLTLTPISHMVDIPITIMANLHRVERTANVVNTHTRPLMAISMGIAITILVEAFSATLTKAR